ncbi:unnamed protein product [Calicophoron daubneyi]|uniref:K Homology domain-containing protein n=1 Tax=Calicophoron daubneyi TaxID=300641 RepID=A0AAV2T4Q1_CALDB
MVIGKGGMYIQEIKDKTGAYVQISQKSREFNLPERYIIIAGDLDQARSAVHMILGVIAADPQSASCPNLSYHDVRGPVASVYPTGSPYATPVVQCPANAAWLTGSPVDIAAANTAAMMAAMLTPNALTPLGAVAASRNAAFGFFSPSYPATPDLASLAALASSPVAATAAAAALGMTPMLQAAPPPPPALASPVASGGDLAATMSASFTSSSTHSADFVGSPLDPSGAVAAAAQQAALLASFRSKAQLLPHDSSQMGDPAASPGAFLSQSPFMTGPLHMPSSTLLGYPAAVGGGGYPATVPAQQGFIAPKAGQIETHSSPTSGASGTSSASSSPSIAASVALAALSAAAANSSSCSNPIGVLPNPGTLLGVVQTPLSTLNLSQLVPQPLRADQLSLSMGSLSSTPPSLLLALSEAGSALPAMSPGIGSSANSPQGTAALPTSASVFGLYALPSPNPSISTSPVGPLGSYVVCKRVISIPDNVIGLILGPQGRSIIDLQSATGTLIQISQKGVYVPGTQNRLVTITGAQPNVQWAASVIEQRIAIEQLRRDTGSSQTNTVPQIPSAEAPELQQQQQQQQQGLPLFYPHASPLGL